MKKTLILCACMLFAVLIMSGNSFIAKGEEEMSDYRFLEIHYSALMQYKICMLIENPADASFLEDEYVSSALLAISLETGEYVPSATEHNYYKLNYPDKEYNVDNFEILADEEKILSFLKENGIDGVKKYYVLILPTVIDGFLLYVQTDTDFCFVPFLWYGEQFGKFSDRRIYSLEEFQNLSAPQEAELKAFGKTIDSDVKPVMYAGSVMYPLRAILESANIEVIWNEEEKSIVFGDYKLIVDKSIKKDADLVNIKTGEIESFGYFEITNGRTLVDAYIMSAITLRFRFRVTPDWNTYTVHVTDFDVLPVK